MRKVRYLTLEADHGQRLDRFLTSRVSNMSRVALQKVVRSGGCRVDHLNVRAPDMRLRAGQTVELHFPDTTSVLCPEEGPVDILWRDAHILICNKPAGLTVHPCASCRQHTLIQRLLTQIPELGGFSGQRPGVVHRLDKDTSGLLVVALTEADRLTLAAAFARRDIYKEYLALVYGTPPPEGTCHAPLGRSPASKVKMAIVPESHGGRAAHTAWTTLWSAPDGRFSLLSVRIHTGRTHQVRVHMAHLGYPLLGDAVYAPKAIAALAPRQMLHAHCLRFIHPATGQELLCTCPPPPDMEATILSLCRRMQRVVVTGNPGSGKSLFTSCLRNMGGDGICADDVVAQLYAKGGTASKWIGQLDSRLLSVSGAVDKAALLAAMRTRPQLRKEVEHMVHALTRDAIQTFWTQQEAAGAAWAVAEIPLFFEVGWRDTFIPSPLVVGVRCPFNVRIKRVATNRGWSAEKMATIEGWQWPEERKLAACDLVVDNSGDKEKLHQYAHAVLEELLRRRHRENAALQQRLAPFLSSQDATIVTLS